MKSTHDFAHDTGTFDMPTVGSKAHLGHLEQNTSLNGFESVASIGKCAGVDDGVGVLEEGTAHFVGDVNVDDAPLAGYSGGSAGHAGPLPVVGGSVSLVRWWWSGTDTGDGLCRYRLALMDTGFE